MSHQHICLQCSIHFPSARADTKFCSHLCHSAFRRTGTILKGYRRVRDGSGKQVYEHRLVMECHLGRSLALFEVVHHKDGNKLNNTLSNLEILSSQSDHMQEHRQTFSGAVERQCSKCREIKPVSAFYLRNDRPDGLHSHCKDCVRKTPNGSGSYNFRSETYKQCSRCKETKPRAEFTKVRERGKDPNHPWCKICKRSMERRG